MNKYDKVMCQEIALYILSKSKVDEVRKLFNLLYLSDKLHLFRYGSFMYNEAYKAIPDGPVPEILNSMIYNQHADLGRKPAILACRSAALSNPPFLQSIDNKVTAPREYNGEHISLASKECIDDAIKKWDSSQFEKSLYLDEAWQEALPTGENISIFTIAQSMPHHEKLLTYLKEQYKENKKTKKEPLTPRGPISN